MLDCGIVYYRRGRSISLGPLIMNQVHRHSTDHVFFEQFATADTLTCQRQLGLPQSLEKPKDIEL